MSYSHPQYYLAHVWHFKYTRSSGAGTPMTCSWRIAAADFGAAMLYFDEYTEDALSVRILSVERGDPVTLRRSEQ